MFFVGIFFVSIIFLNMFKQLANQNFPEMEDEVTKLWDDKDIFQKSITNRSED